MNILLLAMGIILLLAGRNVFWFLVGCVGFMIGLRLAVHFIPPDNHILAPVIGLVCGIACALLVVFIKKIAIGLAGFFIGAFITLQFSQLFGIEQIDKLWIFPLIGGVIGIVLFSLLYNLALVLFSSCVGAIMILESVRFKPATFSFLFIILIIIGILIQTKLYKKLEGKIPIIKNE
jgi:hypothetical protein